MGTLQMKEGERNYTAMLFVVSVVQIICGASSMSSGWPLVWCGVSFFVVGLAYTRLGPNVFGKRSDGDRSWLNRILLFPFLAMNVAIWHARHRVFSREDSCNEIADGIWLGRRPIDGELPPGVETVVDLTAEFSATPQARKLNYICVPTLDGCAPSKEDFHKLMSRLSSSPGPVYIHCAAGHGRSAMVAVALLVVRGLAADLSDAEKLVRTRRPLISIKKPQVELLNEWSQALHT